MIDMAQRVLTRALLHPTYGLNIQIAAMSGYGWLASGDAPPPSFAAGAIGDETDTNRVAWGDFPPGDPALAISQAAQWQEQGEVMTVSGKRDATNVPLLFRYKHGDPDTAPATRDWLYTKRALQKVIRELMRDTNKADQGMGSVEVYACEGFQPMPPYQPREDVVITGGLVVLFDIRDNAP